MKKIIIYFMCVVLLFGMIPNHNAKANLLDLKNVIIQEEKEMTQTYKVQVSMNQAHIVESGFVWKQGDFGFNIEIEVLDFDTTGATPQIIFRKSNGAVEATEITRVDNKFTYAIRGTELDTPGPCVCDLKLNDSTTKRVSTASFKYFVIPDTMDGLEQEANSYSDTIEQIVGGFDDEISALNEATFFPNIYDNSTFIENKEINPSTGELIDNLGGYGVSDFIKTDSSLGSSIKFSKDGVAEAPTFIYRYRPDKTIRDRLNGQTSISVPDGFIRICIKNAKAALFQVQYDEVSELTPYGGIPKAAYNLAKQNKSVIDTLQPSVETLISTASSLVAKTTELDSDLKANDQETYFTNLFNKDDIYRGKERDAHTGELIDSASTVATSGLISVKPGQTIYLKSEGSAYTPYYIYVYNTNGDFSSRQNGASSFAITQYMSAVSICFKLEKLDTLQVNYNNDAEFEPYGGIPRYNYDKINDMDTVVKVISGEPDENPLAVIKETPGYLSCFLTVGCIGDSLSSGLVSATANYPDNPSLTYLTLYQFSWGQYLARETGNTYYNFSKGGLTTKTWLESEYATQCYDGQHNCTAYIIGLAQNDYNVGTTLGTIADIHDSDYTLNPDTFYGNYGKIIQKIKEMFPLTKPKIFIITDPLQAVEDAGYNNAIREIANHFPNVWLIDLYTYGRDIINSEPFITWKRNSHFNAAAYLQVAYMIQTYIDWIIRTHPGNFKDIELIGTEYTNTAAERQ